MRKNHLPALARRLCALRRRVSARRSGTGTAGTGRVAAALCLLCAFSLLLSGCAQFQREYVEVSSHVDSTVSEAAPDFANISTYTQLRAALSSMVSHRQETAVLRFGRYSGELSEDLSTASWSIRAESALGAWCVETVSYELQRLVSYSEADVSIRYKRTAQEMENVVYLTGTVGLSEQIQQALEQAQTRLVVRLSSRNMDADGALAAVQNAWLENPLCSAAPPQASVEVYSGKGYERVADFTFSYDYSAQWLEQLRQSLSVAVDRVLESVPAGDTQSRIRSACRILSNDCSYDPDVSDFGGTAYGALIIGHANSLGYAQACKLLCDRMDVPCQIIAGRYDRAEHYWNIVEIDGARYHIDVSLAAQLGLSAVFLRSDSALWGRYTWDIDAYAPCLGAATGAQ